MLLLVPVRLELMFVSMMFVCICIVSDRGRGEAIALILCSGPKTGAGRQI